MASLKRFFRSAVMSSHLVLDKSFYFLRRKLRMGNNSPITVFTYRGYGRKDYVFLQGRVLRKRALPGHSSETDSVWRDLLNNFRRIWSVEIRDASLVATVGGNSFDLTTDLEGYFELDSNLEPPWQEASGGWNHIHLKLIAVPWRKMAIEVKASVLIPEKANFGLISDIDDTIIRTEVTSLLKLKMFYVTFLKNARKRKAIQEVGAFYQALKKGPSLDADNPVFYVSKSPWNLYDLLEEFLNVNNLPLGPMLLRDYGLPYTKRPAGYRGHKHENIARILDTYPDMPFILIGDSGEKDVDLFITIARSYPGRIPGIFIRDVNCTRRAQRIRKVIAENPDLTIHFVESYREAAQHAAKHNWLAMDYFTSIT